MHVIVIGVGEVGQHIARTLSAERHEVNTMLCYHILMKL
jgi:Trk K+ transport system NAD-binding subunit